MDKVFQILIVFGLVILLIYRFIRGKGQPYIPYDFISRMRPPLSAELEQRLVRGISEAEEGYRVETDDLLFIYRSGGSLTIYRGQPQGRKRQLQEMAVPVDCTGIAVDLQDGKLYLESDGYWFVYGPA